VAFAADGVGEFQEQPVFLGDPAPVLQAARGPMCLMYLAPCQLIYLA
jgi:hypothetical protein